MSEAAKPLLLAVQKLQEHGVACSSRLPTYQSSYVAVRADDRFGGEVFTDYGDFFAYLANEESPENCVKEVDLFVRRILVVLELRKRGWRATLDEEELRFYLIINDQDDESVWQFNLDAAECVWITADDVERTLTQEVGLKHLCVGREDSATGDLFPKG